MAPLRRLKGQGSVYRYRDAKGRRYYRASIELEPTPEGKRRRLTFTSRSRAVAVQRLEDWKAGRPKEEPIKFSLGAWLDDWLPRHALSIRPSTAIRYRQLAALAAPLSGIPLAKLQSRDLEGLYGMLLRTHAPNTVLHVHRLLFTALRRAEADGLVTRNVAALAKAPRVPRQELTTFSADQLLQLLRSAADDRLAALYLLAVTTGMREGELLGLQWSDIDWDAATVTVRGSLRRQDGVLGRGETKTGRHRRVELTPMALDALRQRRAIQAEERLRSPKSWQAGGYIFTLDDGRPMQGWTFLRNYWRPLLERAGLPYLGFHTATRHGAASLLVAAGVPLKIVSEILGHSTITPTADRYSHVLSGGQGEAVAAMQRLFGQR